MDKTRPPRREDYNTLEAYEEAQEQHSNFMKWLRPRYFKAVQEIQETYNFTLEEAMNSFKNDEKGEFQAILYKHCGIE